MIHTVVFGDEIAGSVIATASKAIRVVVVNEHKKKDKIIKKVFYDTKTKLTITNLAL